jgi:hypothetical protein
MKKIKELRPNSLLKQLQAGSPAQNTIKQSGKGETSISAYTGSPASVNDIAVGIAKLNASFPNMEQGFWSILAERIEANNFTSDRLKEAIEHVLDNFRYKELTVSDIIQFDRRLKLYTYREICSAWMKGAGKNDFEMKEIDGIKFWILKADLIKTGLK